jgi:signal transduction histidine kinase
MPNSTTSVQPHRHRPLTIAIIPGLVTLLVVAMTYAAIVNSRDSRKWVEHTHKVQNTTEQLLTHLLDAESNARGFLLSANEQFLTPYFEARTSAYQDLQQISDMTLDNQSQQQRVTELKALIDSRFAFLDSVRLAQSPGVPRPRPAAERAGPGEGVRRMNMVRDTLRAIATEEAQLLAARDARYKRNVQIAELLIAIGGIVAVLVAFFANGMLARTVLGLDTANADLQLQAQRLEEQATELETQAAELEATAVELEAANVELEEQTSLLAEQRDDAQTSRAEAEQANAAKSRFLSVMSHELRTPLNAIAGYVDLMDAGVHGPVTDTQREDIRRINRAVSQLTSVINDILNYAKLEAGEVRFALGRVEMSEALGNASALMEPQAAAKGVVFRYTPCDTHIIAWADRERVQQVVLNLLSNAVKYTHPGGEVRLSCHMSGNMVHVRVSDTGRGISPRDVGRIFDPFVQLLHGQNTPSDGVGLGLAISRDLARGMGGDITVSSTVGSGSIFEFMLSATKETHERMPLRRRDDDRLGEPVGV